MNARELRALAPQALSRYLGDRLSRRMLDPPLDPRTQEEPPTFLLSAWRGEQEVGEHAAFHGRLVEAIRLDLLALGRESAERSGADFWADAANDERLAGQAFLAAEIEAREILGTIEVLVAAWLVHGGLQAGSHGHAHLLRTLAFLQQGAAHDGLWSELWTGGPEDLRPLVLFGWARCNAAAALRELPALIRALDDRRLPSALWSILAPGGPSAMDLGLSLAGHEELAGRARAAIRKAGGDENLLRDFDLGAGVARRKAPGFSFPEKIADPAISKFSGWARAA